jgi:hypothetical protein
MKHTTLTDTREANGTSLKGYVHTTYGHLLEVFGEPTAYESGDDKVTCEWVIKFEDGLVATIYDWKMGRTPTGFYEWHIGGRNSEVVGRIRELFGVLAD